MSGMISDESRFELVIPVEDEWHSYSGKWYEDHMLRLVAANYDRKIFSLKWEATGETQIVMAKDEEPPDGAGEGEE